MPLTHSQYHQSPKVARSPFPPSSKEPTTPSLPGLTPQVGFTRLAALKNAELGQARVPVQSILCAKKMDARVISAFTRVHSASKTGVNALEDALLPAHDGESAAHTITLPSSVMASSTLTVASPSSISL